MRQILFTLLLFLISHTTMAQMILLEQPPKHYVCYRTSGEMIQYNKGENALG